MKVSKPQNNHNNNSQGSFFELKQSLLCMVVNVEDASKNQSQNKKMCQKWKWCPNRLTFLYDEPEVSPMTLSSSKTTHQIR